jgi:hypothetical protein
MPTFEQSAALQAFRTFLNGKGLAEATLTVLDGFEAMLDLNKSGTRAKHRP